MKVKKQAASPSAEALRPTSMTPVQRIRADWRAVASRITYKGIVSNVPFVVFLALLGVLYIANSHRAVEMQRQLNRQAESIRNLRMEETDLQTQLMKTGTEAQIIQRGAALGLKPLTLPAYSLGTDSLKPVQP